MTRFVTDIARPELVTPEGVRGGQSLCEPRDVPHAAFTIHLGPPQSTPKCGVVTNLPISQQRIVPRLRKSQEGDVRWKPSGRGAVAPLPSCAGDTRGVSVVQACKHGHDILIHEAQRRTWLAQETLPARESLATWHR